MSNLRCFAAASLVATEAGATVEVHRGIGHGGRCDGAEETARRLQVSVRDKERQPIVAEDCVNQVLAGNRSLVGLMLESASTSSPGV